MDLYRAPVRPALFRVDPENAYHLAAALSLGRCAAGSATEPVWSLAAVSV